MSVEIVDLSVAYNGGPRVVDSVEMRVATGEWLAVIGPNGAGKSTLLKAIASLISHDSWATVKTEDLDSAVLTFAFRLPVYATSRK